MDEDVKAIIEKFLVSCRRAFNFYLGACLLSTLFFVNSVLILEEYGSSISVNSRVQGEIQKRYDSMRNEEEIVRLNLDTINLIEKRGRGKAILEAYDRVAEKHNRLVNSFGSGRPFFDLKIEGHGNRLIYADTGENFTDVWLAVAKKNNGLYKIDKEFVKDRSEVAFYDYYKDLVGVNPEVLRRAFLEIQSMRRQISQYQEELKRISEQNSDNLRLVLPKEDEEQIVKRRLSIKESNKRIQEARLEIQDLESKILAEDQLAALQEKLSEEINEPFELSGFSLSVARLLPFLPIVLLAFLHWNLISIQQLASVLAQVLKKDHPIFLNWFVLFRNENPLMTSFVLTLYPALFSFFLFFFVGELIFDPIDDAQVQYDYSAASLRGEIIGFIAGVLSLFYFVAYNSFRVQILRDFAVNQLLKPNVQETAPETDAEQ